MSYIAGGTTIRADINQALVEAPNGDAGLIGAEIFPLLPVDAKSGQYLKVQLAQADLLNNDSRFVPLGRNTLVPSVPSGLILTIRWNTAWRS